MLVLMTMLAAMSIGVMSVMRTVGVMMIVRMAR
jgi:hypothetical protein